MKIVLANLYDRLGSAEVHELVDQSGYPPEVRAAKTAAILDEYRGNPAWPIFGAEMAGELVGLIGLRLDSPRTATLRHIVVRQDHRGMDIGREMIQALCRRYSLKELAAETDRDAVTFYRKAGFEVDSLGEKYPGVERFRCRLRIAGPGAVPFRWLFFDLGWTLVDESVAHRMRWDQARTVLAPWGIRQSTDELMARSETAGTAFAASPFLAVLSQLGLDEEQRKTVAAQARYSHAHERVFPGAAALLADLARTYSLGILANQSPGTEERLKAWGIHPFFCQIHASAEAGLAKPDPRFFAQALAQANCAPAEVVMVGDRLDNDIAPARAQGWRTIRVLQGFSRHQQPRTAQEVADATIPSLDRLPEALGRLQDNARPPPAPPDRAG